MDVIAMISSPQVRTQPVTGTRMLGVELGVVRRRRSTRLVRGEVDVQVMYTQFPTGLPLPESPVRTQRPTTRESAQTVSRTGCGRQVPASHTPEAQALPQVPQLVAFVRVSTSQPSALLPLQLAKPVAQVMPQVRAAQVGKALLRVGQTVPQAPQFATLDRVSTSQPFAGTLSQLAKPVAQAPRLQTPAEQVAVALMSPGQGLVQAPQCAVLVWVSTQMLEQRV